MPSEYSIQRLARLAAKVQSDLRRGGMAINFRMMFRSTSTLTRVVAMLAEQVSRLTAEVESLRARAGSPAESPSAARPASPAQRPGGGRVRSGARLSSDPAD